MTTSDRTALRRFVSWYGAGPLHLLVLAGCFALATYAGLRLWGAQPIGVTIWLFGAVIAHDLVLFPLYALADRSTRRVLRHHKPEPAPGAPGINYVRVPVIISALLLLVYFPVIFGLSDFFRGVTTYTTEFYLTRYLAIVGALFLGSAVAYAWRLRKHRGPTPESGTAETARADHGFLSDCQCAALVSRDGSVDFFSAPIPDSPPVLGRLSGSGTGHWSIRPTSPFEVTRQYVETSLVLRTVFRTATGSVTVTDALVRTPGDDIHDFASAGPSVLVRELTGLDGEVEIETVFAPEAGAERFTAEQGRVVVRTHHGKLELTSGIEMGIAAGVARGRRTIAGGQTVVMALGYRPKSEQAEPSRRIEALIPDTHTAWRSWAAHTNYHGWYRDQVLRSATVLHGLTCSWTAAARHGTALIQRAQSIAICPVEVERFFRAFAGSLGHRRQLPILGELLLSADVLAEQIGEFDRETRALLTSAVDQVAAEWSQQAATPGQSVQDRWTVSMGLCWAAVDRGVALADLLNATAQDVRSWEAARAEIRTVLARALEEDELDTSTLALPLLGFLPADDPRMLATIHAIDERLAQQASVDSSDGHLLLVHDYWLVECLAMAGETERAIELFERISNTASDLGLFTGTVDMAEGNPSPLPDALVHASLINAAWRLTQHGGN